MTVAFVGRWQLHSPFLTPKRTDCCWLNGSGEWERINQSPNTKPWTFYVLFPRRCRKRNAHAWFGRAGTEKFVGARNSNGHITNNHMRHTSSSASLVLLTPKRKRIPSSSNSSDVGSTYRFRLLEKKRLEWQTAFYDKQKTRTLCRNSSDIRGVEERTHKSWIFVLFPCCSW